VKVYRRDVAQGSIEPLRTGFRARVFAGRDPITGRKTYLRGETRRVRRDAEADRDRLLAQVEADQHPDQHATVSVLLDQWTEVVDHELSTASTTAGYIRRTLKPALGDMPLRKLQHRVDVLDRLYTHLRRCNRLCDSSPARKTVDDGTDDSHVCRPMSPSAVRRVHAILSAALNYAVSWGWIERNPADYAHPPKLPRRRALPPRPEQVAELLNAAAATDEELAVFLWLAVTSGARRGELVALRWTDVALDRGSLRLESSYVVRDGQRRLKGTKTDDERWLSVDALTVATLEALRTARQSRSSGTWSIWASSAPLHTLWGLLFMISTMRCRRVGAGAQGGVAPLPSRRDRAGPGSRGGVWTAMSIAAIVVAAAGRPSFRSSGRNTRICGQPWPG
jgi:integrase